MTETCAAIRWAGVTGCAAEQVGGPKPLHVALALTKLERQASARRLTSARPPAAHHAARPYQRARAPAQPWAAQLGNGRGAAREPSAEPCPGTASSAPPGGARSTSSSSDPYTLPQKPQRPYQRHTNGHGPASGAPAANGHAGHAGGHAPAAAPANGYAGGGPAPYGAGPYGGPMRGPAWPVHMVPHPGMPVKVPMHAGMPMPASMHAGVPVGMHVPLLPGGYANGYVNGGPAGAALPAPRHGTRRCHVRRTQAALSAHVH